MLNMYAVPTFPKLLQFAQQILRYINQTIRDCTVKA
jgi:hypothetical protein